jgi:hypothetical protein
MRPVRGVAIGALVLLAVIGAASVDGTSSAYVDTTSNASNPFTAAPDWTAPVAGASIIAKSGGGDPGYIRQGGTYYLYSTVGDSGNPAAGVASVTADASAISPAQSAVSQSAGAWTVGATAYNYRSPLMTANATLAAGSAPWSLTSADAASPPNSATQSFSATVDNTAPTATDIGTTNVAGGTIAKPEPGDTVILTSSEPLDPQSILSGWTGDATAVIVAITDGSTNVTDTMQIRDLASTTLPLGTIDLGRSDYATGPVTFGQTSPPSTMTRAGNTIVVTLGGITGTIATSHSASMTWTPSILATDRAGNPMSTTLATESGAPDKDF